MFSLRASSGFDLVILLTVILSNSEWAVAQNQATGTKDQQAAPEPVSGRHARRTQKEC